MEMKWKEEVSQIVKGSGIELDDRHKDFVSYISAPLEFYHSKPKEYKSEATKQNLETDYQRYLKDNDKWVLWYDIELPIGQTKSECGRTINKCFVDMIGELKVGKRPVIGELKYYDKYKGSVADHPFEATIQLLAYYCMIMKNADILEGVRHKPVDPFEWKKLRNNPILMLRANNDYWDYWRENKKEERDEVLKQIINVCKDLDIQLWDENGPIEYL